MASCLTATGFPPSGKADYLIFCLLLQSYHSPFLVSREALYYIPPTSSPFSPQSHHIINSIDTKLFRHLSSLKADYPTINMPKFPTQKSSVSQTVQELELQWTKLSQTVQDLELQWTKLHLIKWSAMRDRYCFKPSDFSILMHWN